MIKKQSKGTRMLVVVAILAMILLTACGGSGATEEPAAADPQTVTGTGQGYAGDVVVEVTVLEGVIQSIEVTESADTPGLSDGAFDAVIEAVLESQSTDVDVVSGATGSSEGILEAIEDALSKVQ